MSSAIQRIVCASISLATGESTQAPTFGLTADAMRSPSMPSGAGEEVMYPQNLGWPLNSDSSNSSLVVARSSGPGAIPRWGSFPVPSNFRMRFGAEPAVTLPLGIDARNFAVSSTARRPTDRNAAGDMSRGAVRLEACRRDFRVLIMAGWVFDDGRHNV